MDDEYADNPTSIENSIPQRACTVIRRALASEHTFKPLKKEDIFKDIVPNGSRRDRAFFYEQIMTLAQDFLSTRCGLRLVPLPPRELPVELKTREERLKDQLQAQTTNAPAAKKIKLADDVPAELITGTTFILESILPKKFQSLVADVRSQDDRQFRTHSIIMLIMLVLDNGYMEKDTLRSRVQEVLNLEPSVFEDLTAKMLRRQYLLRKRLTADKEYFALGPRAKAHLSPDGIKAVMRRLLGPKYTQSAIDKIDAKLKALNIELISSAP